MTTKELICSLKICSSIEIGCTGCGYYNEEHNAKCMRKMALEAATRLEELTAELEAERHRHDRYVDFELAESAELAKVKAERDELKAEIERIKRNAIENSDDWVDD